MITMDAPSSATQSPGVPHVAQRRVRFRGYHLLHLFFSITLASVCVLAFVALGVATGWKLPKSSTLLNQKPDVAEDWCKEHGVANSECVECNPALLPRPHSTKWCKEHGVSECPHCHPEIAELPSRLNVTKTELERVSRALAFTPRVENDPKCKKHERRIQLASDEVAQRLGMTLFPVSRGGVEEVVTAPGEIGYDPTRLARSAPVTMGNILRLERQVGDKVRRGDLLAIIESPEVGKAKAEFQQAIVQFDLRRERFAKLQAQAGSVPGKDLLAAEAAVEEADVRVITAEAGLSNLGLSIRSDTVRGLSPLEVAQKMQYLGLPDEYVRSVNPGSDSSNFLPVTAPFDGEVIVRAATEGEGADPAKALFVVADTSAMWLTLHVRQEDVGRIQVGQTARFRHAGHTGAVAWDPGTVVWISPAADEKTRTVSVRIRLVNPTDRHYANTTGTAEVILRQESNAILVPASAVHWEGCCHIAFVRDKGYGNPDGPRVFHVRKVRLGARITTPEGVMVEIAAGLLPGEIVAASNSGFLRSELLKNNLGEGCACCAGK